MSDVVLYDLGPSSNNMKVRIACNYKGISFDKIPVAPDDIGRETVIEVSGQPLTPVLKHGDSVIFDSAAILRYLEANFPATKKIFFADREQMREAEKMETWVRTALTEPVGTAFGQFMTGEPDMAEVAAATARLNEETGKLESRLESSAYLMGDEMSFVDITAAPAVFYSMVPQEMTAVHPAIQFLYDHFRLGEGRDRTRDWCMRVMAYDR